MSIARLWRRVSESGHRRAGGLAEQLEGRDRPGDQARGKEGGAGGRSRRKEQEERGSRKEWRLNEL
jgi:hypothetical protein